jgi:hypothetical protein
MPVVDKKSKTPTVKPVPKMNLKYEYFYIETSFR